MSRAPSRRTVLLVDDDRTLRDVLAIVLDLEDVEVLTADDGTTALDLLASHTPDVIVSDVMMPGMDGLELCRRVKADPATAAIPLILLTVHNDPADHERGYAAGCDAYLTKPFSPLALIDLVRTVESRGSDTTPSGRPSRGTRG